MFLKTLMDQNLLKFIISQNVDGLHLKSGINYTKIAELHGNKNLEICKKCKKSYNRDFNVRVARKANEHLTGRKCDNKKCGGDLEDSIINFNEILPVKEANLAIENCEKADLLLIFGSSLTIAQAPSLPEITRKKGGKVVIFNLQKTEFDDDFDLCVYGEIEEIVQKLSQRLKIKIPQFKIKRNMVISFKDDLLEIRSIDLNGNPLTYLKSVSINFKKKISKVQEEPYVFQGNFSEEHELEFEFFGFNFENNLVIPIEANFDYRKLKYLRAEFDLKLKVWDECYFSEKLE